MNIFIAGLSYGLNDTDLAELFEEFGQVSSARIIMDRETGRSKGYGFVEMEDEEAGNKAIQELNEKEVEGKQISVSVARPQEERPRRSFGNGGGGYGGGNRGGGDNRGGGYGGGGGRNRY